MLKPAIECLLEDNIEFSKIFGVDAYYITYEEIDSYVAKWGVSDYDALLEGARSLDYTPSYCENSQLLILTRETP